MSGDFLLKCYNMSKNNQTTPNIPNAPMPIIDAGKYIKKKYGKILIVAIAIAVVLEFLVILSGIINLTIIPIVAFLIFYAAIRQKAEDAFLMQFASVNGFTFQKTGLPKVLTGSLFSVGYCPMGHDLVMGNFQDIPFNLFNYQYTVGSGKNSHTYIYTVFSLDFSSSLPPIFLKPKYCTFGGFLSSDISGEARESLKLEGDFNKYFDLWVKHDFQIEALQFLTPDVMEDIESNWQRFSLEFVEDRVYIYSAHMITKDEELENMYQFAKYLIPKIVPFAKEIKGDIDALNEYQEKTTQ